MSSLTRVAFALLFLTACMDRREQESASVPAEPAPAAAAAQPPVTEAAPTAPAAPPAAQAASSAVIASADGEKPGIRAEVTEFKRASGDTVNLKFTMINNSSDDLGFGYDFGASDMSIKDHASVGGIHLLDPVNKKKYLVVRDAENDCLCSRNLSKVEAGSRMPLWAKFPAPPPDVKALSIVIPHFPPMDDVPLQ